MNCSNEITAIPELLKLLNVKGCTVTIDAMGTQKQIARQIREQKGHYVLALKGNPLGLQRDMEQLFDEGIETDFAQSKHERCRMSPTTFTLKLIKASLGGVLASLPAPKHPFSSTEVGRLSQ